MSYLTENKEGAVHLLMGNEAIVRGALEAGVRVATGYPGTPASEIIERLSQIGEALNIYAQWSVNEKVALEVAAAASFAGLRSLCAMKQNGVNVASDFLLHLAGTGTRGGMILVSCEDPGAISSVNEGDSRFFARMLEFPLLEPADFQEAKEMTRWAFELSETIQSIVMIRSVTRISHGSGNVIFGPLADDRAKAFFKHDGILSDPTEGPIVPSPVRFKHDLLHDKLEVVGTLFEDAPFNVYLGAKKPELLMITSSACYLYAKEAVHLLDLGDRVGILKLGTTWPLPEQLVTKYLGISDQILIIEEVLPFLEEQIKALAAEKAHEIGAKTFFGKRSRHLPSTGELGPDLVIEALCSILGTAYSAISKDQAALADGLVAAGAPNRALTFCAGCPHRASFWSIRRALELDNRKGFVCGDIGCYSMAMWPSGFSTIKTLHAMGSGSGLASGFGKLGRFGMDQPVLAVCGDSTFFHTVIPALINATHHQADFTLVVLDNAGTAMTGFQSHPGLDVDAMGNPSPPIDIVEICRAIGARVEVKDPFDLEETQETILRLLEDHGGARVLVLRQICALSPEKKAKKPYDVRVDQEICKGEACGCNRLCTRIFGCPGLVWDAENQGARIDDLICTGCGVCADICPEAAIKRKEAA